jgi:hypothetical protein
MLDPKQVLRPNREEEIAAHVFDDEAVIMRLTDGAYFNMNRAGGLVWNALEQGCNLDDVVSAVTARFQVSADQARADVERLLEDLIRERLVASSEAGHPDTAHSSLQATVGSLSRVTLERMPYESPTLLRHDDVADLLALDPPFGEDCLCGRRGGDPG